MPKKAEVQEEEVPAEEAQEEAPAEESPEEFVPESPQPEKRQQITHSFMLTHVATAGMAAIGSYSMPATKPSVEAPPQDRSLARADHSRFTAVSSAARATHCLIAQLVSCQRLSQQRCGARTAPQVGIVVRQRSPSVSSVDLAASPQQLVPIRR